MCMNIDMHAYMQYLLYRKDTTFPLGAQLFTLLSFLNT